MSQLVTRQNVFYAFEPGIKEAVRLKQGDEVVIQTHDCFHGQLQSQSDLVEALDWDHVNPATGPVYIEGVQPGDILRVHLLEIKVADHSTMVTVPGEGVLGGDIKEMETVLLEHLDGKVIFKGKIEIPANPMIGVIGVAPASGRIPNGTPGPHGGNMDCTLITAGTRVYFTAGVQGALFGCGDMHAVMGDGEIVVCGAETAGEVRLKAKVVPLPGLPTPFLETDKVVATVYSAPGLDEAASQATRRMARFLTDFVKMPLNDAGMLMSLVGQLRFCQVVDPEKTVRFEFPKWVLEKYGFRLPDE